MAIYTGGDRHLEWREVETGHLPTPRNGLKSLTESWEQAGNLAVERSWHAAVAVPSSIIESECLAMFLK